MVGDQRGGSACSPPGTFAPTARDGGGRRWARRLRKGNEVMTPGRVIALVVGCLLLVPGLGLLLGGGALGAAYAFGRDDDGYFEADLGPPRHADRRHHRGGPDPRRRPGIARPGHRRPRPRRPPPGDQRRRRARPSSSASPPSGRSTPTSRASPTTRCDTSTATVRHLPRSGPVADEVAPPTEQSFWVASATGTGTQRADVGGDRRPLGGGGHERRRVPRRGRRRRRRGSRPDSSSRSPCCSSAAAWCSPSVPPR